MVRICVFEVFMLDLEVWPPGGLGGPRTLTVTVEVRAREGAHCVHRRAHSVGNGVKTAKPIRRGWASRAGSFYSPSVHRSGPSIRSFILHSTFPVALLTSTYSA